MRARPLQLFVWLVAIPIVALLVAHGLFWALVDATGTSARDERMPLLVAAGLTVGGVIAVVRALARRAGKPRDAALGWGLTALAAAIAWYALFAVSFFLTHGDRIG